MDLHTCITFPHVLPSFICSKRKKKQKAIYNNLKNARDPTVGKEAYPTEGEIITPLWVSIVDLAPRAFISSASVG